MKLKRIAVLLSIVMLGNTLAGCDLRNRAEAYEPINSVKSLEGTEELVIVEELDAAYVKGLNEFAYHVFSKMEDGDNVFLSPYSISLALSMLYNGADGETRTEMAEMLGYNHLKEYSEEYSEISNSSMNANSKFLIEALQKADPKVKVSIANSIWLSKEAAFQDSVEAALLAPVRGYYNGDIFKVDFTEDKTLQKVNEWVSDKTEGMIDPFLEEFNNKEMLRLFLVNAIYFNGKWSNPFDQGDTRTESFYGANTTKSVDMMFMYNEEYRYYTDYGIRGIEIPYGNGSLVMDVLIPEDTKNKTIAEVYGELTTENVNLFLKKLDEAAKEKLQTLQLPKFEMEYGMVSLNKALQELGMKRAFEEGNADFGLIGDNLHVSQVVHKAKIQVEEWGTKAAAATGIDVETTSFMPIEDPLEFIVDVPFIFFIRDTQTGAILFIGEMNQID